MLFVCMLHLHIDTINDKNININNNVESFLFNSFLVLFIVNYMNYKMMCDRMLVGVIMDLLQNELRPNNIKDVIGQKHLIGENKILTNLVKSGKIFNVIFYGKSGIGKTTIALALINELKMNYRILNATINSKKDFDIVFEEAKMYGNLILVIDEIHRMNKDKQDLLLSYLESGLITLIGLTSSNPYHSINPAIRSRCQILELKPIETDDIIIAIKGIKKVYKDLKLDKKTIEYIASLSNGDLRYAYNLIEFCYFSFGPTFNIDNIKEINTKPNMSMDKNDTDYYDTISAFQKSIRGSDVDASLHYLARLLEKGDFDIIYRRLLAICYEDIGLANPSMGPKLVAAIDASERLGFPEMILPLSNIVIDMALSPKSNSAMIAINAALGRVREGNVGAVPNNVTNHTKDYIYPHDYPPFYYAKQQYLPTKIKDDVYYKPKINKYESEMKKFNDIKKENKKN